MEFDELRVSAKDEGRFGFVLRKSPVRVGGERLSVHGQDVHLRRRRRRRKEIKRDRGGGGGEERRRKIRQEEEEEERRRTTED